MLFDVPAPYDAGRRTALTKAGYAAACAVAIAITGGAPFGQIAGAGDGFGRADYVGTIPLGQAAVGMAISPDGRWLYATSELGDPLRGSATWPGTLSQPGTLTVIDLRKAETDPRSSIVAMADAGCQPVRVITSADGTQAWVTAPVS